MDQLDNKFLELLKEAEVNVSILSENDIQKLVEIYNIYLKHQNVQETLLQSIKENKLTLLSLSSDASFSRQTLYKKASLKSFADFCVTLFNKNYPQYKTDALYEKINQLQLELEKMYLRDLKELQLRDEVNQLKELLSEKKKEIKQLQIHNTKLNEEVFELRRQTLKLVPKL